MLAMVANMYAHQQVAVKLVLKFMCFKMVWIIIIIYYPNGFLLNFFSWLLLCVCVVLGERPEAMQTGTSTYFADKGYIMHTLLVATIISIYNIFRDYYSSIIIERISIDDITWPTSARCRLQRNFQWILKMLSSCLCVWVKCIRDRKDETGGDIESECCRFIQSDTINMYPIKCGHTWKHEHNVSIWHQPNYENNIQKHTHIL